MSNTNYDDYPDLGTPDLGGTEIGDEDLLNFFLSGDSLTPDNQMHSSTLLPADGLFLPNHNQYPDLTVVTDSPNKSRTSSLSDTHMDMSPSNHPVPIVTSINTPRSSASSGSNG